MQVHVLGVTVAAAAVASAGVMTGSGVPWAYEFEQAEYLQTLSATVTSAALGSASDACAREAPRSSCSAKQPAQSPGPGRAR